MTNPSAELPDLPETFRRIEEAIRNACLLVEDVQRGADVAAGLHRHEALRHLSLARNHAEDLHHRIDLAIKAAQRGL